MRPSSIPDLENVLRSLSHDVTFPPSPDVRAAVIERISAAPARRPIRSPWRLRTALVAAAVVAIALVTTVSLSPGARRAVADWLGVDGIRITFDDHDTPPLGEDLQLGNATSLDEAAGAVDFDIAVPEELGRPDGVFLNTDVEGGQVSLVWEPAAGLPESEHTGVGAILTQFVGTADPLSVKKVATSGTEVRFLTIDGRDAFFVEGAPHVVIRDADGGARTLEARLAGNTLVWDGGDVTYRLEADVDLDRALEIAESLP